MLDNLLVGFALLMLMPVEGTDYSYYDTPYNRMAIMAWSEKFQWASREEGILDETWSRQRWCEELGVYKPCTFSEDLKMLQERRLEMMTWPVLEDFKNFVSLKVVEDYLQLNVQYQSYLSHWLDICPAHKKEDVEAAISETTELRRIWELLQAARRNYSRNVNDGQWCVYARRQYLLDLREILGYECFYAGRMPPPIPLHRLPKGY